MSFVTIPLPGTMVVQVGVRVPVPPARKIVISPSFAPLHVTLFTVDPIDIGSGSTISSLRTETQPVDKSLTVTE